MIHAAQCYSLARVCHLLRYLKPPRWCRFANRESLDFGTAQDLTPTQEFTLNEDFRGILEYPVTYEYPRRLEYSNAHLPVPFLETWVAAPSERQDAPTLCQAPMNG